MSSCLSERHSRSINRLSIQRPRPSIEMRTPADASAPVKAASRNTQQLALAADRQPAVISINERAAVRGADLPDLFAKKSRSTMSWPILAVQLLDLPLTIRRTLAIAALECPRRLI